MGNHVSEKDSGPESGAKGVAEAAEERQKSNQ